MGLGLPTCLASSRSGAGWMKLHRIRRVSPRSASLRLRCRRNVRELRELGQPSQLLPHDASRSPCPTVPSAYAEGERFKPPILEDAATYVGLARDCRVDADLAILPNRTHMTAVEELVSREDPSFLLIMAFVHRLSEVGPRTHLADPDRCPTPIR